MSLASLAGQQFEKYDVLDEVGHGGMAVVYRARDRDLDREVAIKVLHAHLADREESRQRLRREAITVAKLRHENIVEIFDYSGADGEESYIVTEFIHGVTLRKWLDTRWEPRPVLAALIIHRLCLALIHAHDLGIVHRDIKPENVMIREDGALKLMDFGIAQILDHQKLTMTGQLLGSPAYMAPELIGGKPVDARTDLFAVGIMLYQLATAQLPFQGRNPHEVLNRIADCEYPKAATVNPIVDEELETIIAKALCREPDGRYASARAFANDLEDYLAGMGVDPDGGVLEGYFEDTEKVVDELDASVVAHLLDRAEAATTSGNSPRALKLLGRVLEYEPDNRRAQSLLDAAKVRGRRMRQLLMGVAGVAIIGMVTAAALLMKNPPAGQPLMRAGRDVERTDAAPGEVRDDDGPVGEISEGDGMEIGPSLAVEGDTGGAITGVAQDGGRAPRPNVLDDDTGGDGGEGPQPRPGGHTKVRPPQTVQCVVKVNGLAISLRTHHQIAPVGGGSKHAYDATRQGYVVPFPGTSDITVRLDGDRYTGRATLSRKACEVGPVVLEATPKPIRLDVRDAKVDAGDILVQCDPPTACAQKMANRWRHELDPGEQTELLTLKFSDGETGALVDEKKVELYPGTNVIKVDLTPRK